jgi:hypothetical protein
MKKIILILSILTFTASSCKQVTKQQATAEQAETVNNEVVIEQQVEEERQSEKKIKYQFKEADYYAEFYENGDYLEDAPSLLKPQSGTYKEYPTHLQLSVNGNNMGNMEFFDDLGQIVEGWQIINYRKVNSFGKKVSRKWESERLTAQNKASDDLIKKYGEWDKIPDEQVEKFYEKWGTSPDGLSIKFNRDGSFSGNHFSDGYTGKYTVAKDGKYLLEADGFQDATASIKGNTMTITQGGETYILKNVE